MSVIVDLSLFPVGKGESVAEYVARAVKIIRDSGLPHRLGPMGTAIEGEYDEIMAVVGRCFKALQADCDRVYMTLKVDGRAGRSGGLEQKVGDVEKRLVG
ncbi:MTH1187 family thiamine-binding protein [Desulfocurvibacter africanus]|uniref:MTH1187 family thiamine-binding protein n=1 Tax=Desulfocurvibacter africanus TaxID=873 RepID=UPI0003FC043B|nr:MTH1187 family thiamine-binding protein [Desulfocurvibacter africanus]